MSRWSMIATSPGLSRRVSRFVVRSRRAGPVTSAGLATLGSADRREELGSAEHPLELLPPLGRVELRDARVRWIARDLVDAEVAGGGAPRLRPGGGFVYPPPPRGPCARPLGPRCPLSPPAPP